MCNAYDLYLIIKVGHKRSYCCQANEGSGWEGGGMLGAMAHAHSALSTPTTATVLWTAVDCWAGEGQRDIERKEHSESHGQTVEK